MEMLNTTPSSGSDVRSINDTMVGVDNDVFQEPMLQNFFAIIEATVHKLQQKIKRSLIKLGSGVAQSF